MRIIKLSYNKEHERNARKGYERSPNIDFRHRKNIRRYDFDYDNSVESDENCYARGIWQK